MSGNNGISKVLNKIAYVEDELDVQKIVKLSLEKVGKFNTRIYSNGPEALEDLPIYMPDLILLDVLLPEMDGIEIFSKIREMQEMKSIPIVFMTAKSKESEQKQLLSLGALDVVMKPINPMELPNQLRSIWGKYEQN